MTQEMLFSQTAIQLDTRDPLAIAKQEIRQGWVLQADIPGLPFQQLTIRQTIPSGHKLALKKIAAGEEIARYGSRIGQATQDILPGEWIHTHNLSVGEMNREFVLRTAQPHLSGAPDAGHRFMGYQRPNGRVGTRNFIAVISTVSCSAQTAREIAQSFPREALADFPNVDGVVAVTHSLGCCDPIGGTVFRYLQRALLNLTRHPNVGGVIFVSLGCENNQMAELTLPEPESDSCVIGPFLTIQQEGGIEKTVAAGVAAVNRMLPRINSIARSPAPLRALTAALQCGGSDGWSGVTANPLVGRVADQIVHAGGTVVLAETPEIYGAEQLLLRRVISPAVGEKLIERIRWWQAQAALLGFSLDNNPSPGNKAGGLTTIFEKSLGAVAKGGVRPWPMWWNTRNGSPPRGWCLWTRPATTRFRSPDRWREAVT